MITVYVILLLGIIYSAECQENLRILLTDPVNTTGHEVTKECREQWNMYLTGLRNGSHWAFRMLDATGKLQSGVFEGNLAELGSFDECMDVFDEDSGLEGKYCVARLNFHTVRDWLKLVGYEMPTNDLIERAENTPIASYMWGTCVPDACTQEDLIVLSQRRLNFSNLLCQTKSSWPKVSSADVNAISVITFLVIAVISATLYEMYITYSEQKAVTKLLYSFSIISNWKRLMARSDNPAHLNFICGIRTITMMWILLGHMYLFTHTWPVTNLFDVAKFLMSDVSMILLGASVSVDTFFLLSGIFTTYTFLVSRKRGDKFNVMEYYMHRYFRLTPSLAILVLISATFFKHISSGPIWPVATDYMCQNCQDYWWSTLLYTQNIFNTLNMCVPVSWYLSVDMQLFLMSPLLLVPLLKHPKATLSVTALLACTSVASAYYIAFKYNFHAVLNEMDVHGTDYVTKYYMATLPRSAPWFIGVIMGYILFQYKFVYKSVKINKLLVAGLWVVSMILLFVCVFGGHNLVLEDRNNMPLNRAYIAFIRPTWAIALSWIIFACTAGYGGWVNTFLSIPFFQIVAKLSYGIYLLHTTVLTTIALSMRDSFRWSNSSALYYYWAHFTTLLMLSVFWYLTFETPFVVVYDILKRGRSKKTVKNVVEKPPVMPTITEKPPKEALE